MFRFLSRPKRETALDPAAIRSLVGALRSDDRHERERTRKHLVAIGAPAIAPLLELLSDQDEHVRWEAAKVLSRICTPEAAASLVEFLEDRNSAIRWLAAQGLIAAGRAGLPPLLRALIQRSNSVWLREGAHRVLLALARRSPGDPVAPVLDALEDIEPALEVPPAAAAALHAFE
ncbi:MAG: HEAT repeat domain-containing protein [Ardenticatenaceae bacterium]|nr:HEAT repeat domain-containing protein [Ardenticatenaceae bacterium]HBY95461.1 hypothetical protein [Chloroflexota bacterium]